MIYMVGDVFEMETTKNQYRVLSLKPLRTVTIKDMGKGAAAPVGHEYVWSETPYYFSIVSHGVNPDTDFDESEYSGNDI